MMLGKYKYDELSCTKWVYFWLLLIGKSGGIRKKLNHYAYHFGFDHTSLLKVINANPCLKVLSTKKYLSTVFIVGVRN